MKVHLCGPLKTLHDGPIEVIADTVAEAVKIVTSQIRGLRPNAITGYKRVQVAECDKVEDLFSPTSLTEIHLLPQMNGGKRGGFIQILIGAALVGASFLIPGAGAFLGGILLQVGALMILGGVLQLIRQPTRDNPNSSATNRSHYLGVPENTVAIGTRIPILYGRRKVGLHLLSVNLASTSDYSGTGPWGSGG